LERETFTVKKLVRNQSFRKWTEGEASQREAEFWDNWIQEGDENQKKALEAQKIILGFYLGRKQGARPKIVWDRIESEINRKEKPGFYPVGEINHADRNLFSRKSSFRLALKYAAIILIMLTGGWLWSVTSEDTTEVSHYEEREYRHVSTVYGEQKEINLSDGSYIVLNANSSLQFSIKPGSEKDVDIILDGEAYFSVTSRQNGSYDSGENIFRVETADGSLKVLGTSFSVSSHSDKTRIVLEEGKVLVLPAHKYETDQQGLVLQPNELVEFSRLNTDIIRQVVDSRVYTSWKDSRLILQSTPMAEVVERLEQTFGIPVNVRDSSVLNRTISGSIENTDLNTMIHILGELMDIHVEVQEEAVYLGQ
jgi:transmembrane sensor